MTYNEKKSLYESIMKDVAKTVKQKINESDLSLDDYLNSVFEQISYILKTKIKDFRRNYQVIIYLLSQKTKICQD